MTEFPPVTGFGLSASVLNAGGFTVRFALLVVPLYVPETLPVVLAVTATVVTVKVEFVAPAGTTTLAGTAAAALAVVKEITAPPLGAIPFSVAVPVEETPPMTVAGLKLIEESAAGFTVRFAVLVTLL